MKRPSKSSEAEIRSSPSLRSTASSAVESDLNRRGRSGARRRHRKWSLGLSRRLSMQGAFEIFGKRFRLSWGRDIELKSHAVVLCFVIGEPKPRSRRRRVAKKGQRRLVFGQADGVADDVAFI